MSSELYFYKVKKVDRILPKVIDIDETPIDYSYSDEEHAADWEKRYRAKMPDKASYNKHF